MKTVYYDYTVIGSGPGGYVSAIRAAQLGLKVCLIEKAELGGVCLNWGCIPTKALLESAHFYHKICSKELGISGLDNAKPQLKQMVANSRKTVKQLTRGIDVLLKKHGIHLVEGEGYVESSDTVIIKNKNQQVKTEYLCLATGAIPREFPGHPFSKHILNAKESMLLEDIPKSLLVVGAGAIGCEFADLFASLGTQVTIVESAQVLLPSEDHYLGTQLERYFSEKKITVYCSSSVTSLKESSKDVHAIIQTQDGSKELKCDKVLVAIGIHVNIDNINTKNINIPIDNHLIDTDEFGAVKGLDNVFAIGDITHGKQLAHKASRQGIIVAEKIANQDPQPLTISHIPSCIYTSPQIASVGYTEQELKKSGIPYVVGTFPFSASGKAIASGYMVGGLRHYIKPSTHEILGAHYIGENVTELISNIVLTQTAELTMDEIQHSIFPHPTLSEGILESLHNAFNVSIHV